MITTTPVITVHTRFIPATNTKPSRIKVWTENRSAYYPYPQHNHPHEKCAMQFISEHLPKLESFDWKGGQSETGKGYTFIAL